MHRVDCSHQWEEKVLVFCERFESRRVVLSFVFIVLPVWVAH